jgi:type II secretory pathway pseudopilin PulG
MNHARNHPTARRRKGAVLVVTLVCLAIVMALIGQMLVGAVRSRRQMHAERDLLQCEHILQAGIDRAARQIAADAEYDGELLDAPASDIGGIAAGRATIEVSRPVGAPPRIRVQAEYPMGSEHSIRRSRSFTLRDSSITDR